jgi:hypothetical protein
MLRPCRATTRRLNRECDMAAAYLRGAQHFCSIATWPPHFCDMAKPPVHVLANSPCLGDSEHTGSGPVLPSQSTSPPEIKPKACRSTLLTFPTGRWTVEPEPGPSNSASGVLAAGSAHFLLGMFCRHFPVKKPAIR